MPDLKPDLSIFSHPQQMGVGDMLNTVIGIQKYKGQQGISDLMKTNVDPITGDPDLGAVSSKLSTVDGLISPDTVGAIEQGRQAQLASRTQESQAMLRILGPLATKKGVITPDEIADARTRATSVYSGGMRGAQIVEKMFAGATTPEKFKSRAVQLMAGFDMMPKMVTAPGGPGASDTSKPEQQQLQGVIEGGAGGGAPGQPTAPQTVQTKYGPRDVEPLGPLPNVSSEKQKGEYDDRVTKEQQDIARDTQTLEGGITSLAKLGPRGSGEPNAFLNASRKFLVNVGLLDDDEKSVSYETANKKMQGWISQQPGGGHSVEHLINVQGSNPNMSLQQRTNIILMKQALGIRRMEYARFKEFDRLGGNYTQYNNWAARWSGKQDPMAYVWETLTHPQREAYFKDLGPKGSAARRNFENSLKTSKQFELERPDLKWNTEDNPE